MRTLVTGATGFVGPHLVAHVRQCGDEIVEAGDERGDFDVLDRAGVHERLAQAQPDVVFHLAARSDVAESWRDPLGTLRVNVEGTQNVLDAARAAGVRRVVVIGSAEEYGSPVDPAVRLRETDPLRPRTPYGASKVAASFVALQAWLGGGPEVVRVRAFGHTGPGQTARFLVPALARRIAEAERDGRDTIAVGALDPVRDLLDVRDVVRAYRMLASDGAPGDVYNVCRGEGLRVADIAQRLVARARRPLRLATDPALLRPTEVPVLVGDPSKIAAATGWTPRISLDQTLDEVLDEARAHAAGHGS